MQSFGQAIPVLGAGVGFPGNVSRFGERVIVARPVLSTTATNLPFGAGAVLISSATGGSWQSFSDFLATATNAQFLQQYFAGVAVREVKTQLQYLSLQQSSGTVVTTTATQATPGSTTIIVTSATGISVGQSVEGAGIQANTLVTGVSGTTITISLGTLAAMSAVAVAFTSSTSGLVGSYAAGNEGEVLERGNITVVITGNGTPQANSPVFVRTVANATIGGTAVGDFEAADDVVASPPTTTTTVGSTTLTVSSGTNVAVGQRVTGPGIPANTFIVSGATTTWVMSNPATATTATATSVFSNMAVFGTAQDPWLVFRTGQIDSNLISEITIKSRHAA